jgi:hypothetical protein
MAEMRTEELVKRLRRSSANPLSLEHQTADRLERILKAWEAYHDTPGNSYTALDRAITGETE